MVKFFMSPAKWVVALEIVIRLAKEIREYLRERTRGQ